MQVEDLALGVLVWVLEEDFAVDAARSDQGGVERLDLVGGHDDLNVSPVVETIQLIE